MEPLASDLVLERGSPFQSQRIQVAVALESANMGELILLGSRNDVHQHVLGAAAHKAIDERPSETWRCFKAVSHARVANAEGSLLQVLLCLPVLLTRLVAATTEVVVNGKRFLWYKYLLVPCI